MIETQQQREPINPLANAELQKPEPQQLEGQFADLPKSKEEYAKNVNQIIESPQTREDIQSLIKAQEALKSGALKGQEAQEFENVKKEALQRLVQAYQALLQ